MVQGGWNRWGLRCGAGRGESCGAVRRDRKMLSAGELMLVSLVHLWICGRPRHVHSFWTFVPLRPWSRRRSPCALYGTKTQSFEKT